MAADSRSTEERSNDRGVSIVVIAVGMIFVLAMAGFGIDLASLYVGRSEAQRAADAAALAGAKTFTTPLCTVTTGPNISANCQSAALQAAESVGNQNLIAGVSPNIGKLSSDVTFPSTSTSDPRIQVVAARDTAHDNAMPTFFVKIFGITKANVSAKAVAEAYKPNGQTVPIGTNCVKPWLLPNCDANNVSSNPNPNCVNSKTGVIDGGYYVKDKTLVDPGIIGQVITIKPGDPTEASGPGKFYPVFLPAGQVASACPECAKNQSSSGTQSGDMYRQNIECCNQNPVVCGYNPVTAISGNMVGPTDQGVECLIHQSSNGSGQDLYDPTTGTITAGSNNPYPQVSGKNPTTSDSIATIPIYDGSVLCPGGSSNGACTTPVNVNVIAYMQVFIEDVGAPQATVQAYVLSVSTCDVGSGGGGGTTGGTGTGAIIGDSGSAIPVRLIH